MDLFFIYKFLIILTVKSPVILTVSRPHIKMQRSSSISVGTPTPLAQRGGITAPFPVDVRMTSFNFSFNFSFVFVLFTSFFLFRFFYFFLFLFDFFPIGKAEISITFIASRHLTNWVYSFFFLNSFFLIQFLSLQWQCLANYPTRIGIYADNNAPTHARWRTKKSRKPQNFK